MLQSVNAEAFLEIAARILVVITLLPAGVGKILNFRMFRRTIHDYHIIPQRLEPIATWLIPVTELITGIGLMTIRFKRASSISALALLLLFTLAVGSALLKKTGDHDCGCGTFWGRTGSSWGVLGRNLGFSAWATIAGSFIRGQSTIVLFMFAALAVTLSLVFPLRDRISAGRKAGLEDAAEV